MLTAVYNFQDRFTPDFRNTMTDMQPERIGTRKIAPAPGGVPLEAPAALQSALAFASARDNQPTSVPNHQLHIQQIQSQAQLPTPTAATSCAAL